jgi:hypothetical protein
MLCGHDMGRTALQQTGRGAGCQVSQGSGLPLDSCTQTVCRMMTTSLRLEHAQDVSKNLHSSAMGAHGYQLLFSHSTVLLQFTAQKT